MPTIEFRSATVTVDTPTADDPHATRTILGPIDLTLTERRIGIIGANGSGKSTLARLINALIVPTTGSVLIDGLDTTTQTSAVRSRVGFVFSDADNQIIMPNVRDDVAFTLRRAKMKKAERYERADAMLSRFGLANHADDSPHTLSGGQKQLLALAAVLIGEPDIVVADEPTTLLDLRNRLRIARELYSLDQQLIVVTHDLDLLTEMDRVIRIDNGHVHSDGKPNEIISQYIEDMQ